LGWEGRVESKREKPDFGLGDQSSEGKETRAKKIWATAIEGDGFALPTNSLKLVCSLQHQVYLPGGKLNLL
jgi:hypothetical protein